MPVCAGKEDPQGKPPPSWEGPGWQVGLLCQAAWSSLPGRAGSGTEPGELLQNCLLPGARPELSLRCHRVSPSDSAKLASWEQRPGGDLWNDGRSMTAEIWRGKGGREGQREGGRKGGVSPGVPFPQLVLPLPSGKG